ncbi:MAG: T9SS type A sorting domain-containing protein, partial [Ignavibacteria bacterium]|nr:T9SS type A sorting domain-containing protein [Ignavibacteria bacterium]
ILWQTSVGMSYISGVAQLSDLNGDGKKEIAYSMQTPGNVLIVNGATGQVIYTFSFGSTVSFRADRVTALNSVDGNSTTEFVGGCRDGKLICFSGGQNVPIGILKLAGEVPEKFELHHNYPNPFNPSTTIKFDIPKTSNVTLSIFDAAGREIAFKNFSRIEEGSYEYRFDGSKLSSGIYFYKINAGNFSAVKKMVLVK